MPQRLFGLVFQCILLALLFIYHSTQAQTTVWSDMNENQNYEAKGESGFVQAGDKFYILGGLENNDVYEYDVANDTWALVSQAPYRINHFQPVYYQGYIWVIGALKFFEFPTTEPTEYVWLFDPITKEWIQGPEIPPGRRRGAAGLVTYNDKFYFLAGSTNGHNGGYVAWVDEFDPETGQWRQLPDAPTPRDHFYAVVAEDKIYNVAGRWSGGIGGFYEPLISEVDVFDLTTEQWTTLPASQNLPTPRAGAPVAVFEGQIMVMGGEVFQANVYGVEVNETALQLTEAYNLINQTWSRLPDTQFQRHGVPAVVSDNAVYLASGASDWAAAPPQKNIEFYGTNEPDLQELSRSELVVPDQVFFGSTGIRDITVAAANGNTGVYIDRVEILGAGSANYSITGGDLSGKFLKSGAQATISVTSNPGNDGQSATLRIYRTESEFAEVALETNPLVNPGDQAHTTADVINLQIQNLDVSHTYTYQATGLPAGLSISPDQPTISGVIGSDAYMSSPYPVVVTATNTDSQEQFTISFAWTVFNELDIQVQPIMEMESREGDLIEFSVSATGGLEVEDFQYVLSGQPAGISISNTGQISGTLADGSSQGGNGAGNYSPQVTVSKPSSGPVEISFSWQVDSREEGVDRIVLVNADAEEDILEITDQLEIAQDRVQGINLNVRADTNPEVVGSVRLELQGPVTGNRIENVAPYALFGDLSGDYFGELLPLGNYTITVVAYSEPNQQGQAYPELVKSFSIVNTPTVQYQIVASAGVGGRIDPNGTLALEEGSDQSFTIVADEGYRISDVRVDGNSQGVIGSYDFINVSQNHSIEAIFEPIPEYPIVSSSVTGGSITPEGTTQVSEGENQLYTIAADVGYRILDVLVDEVSVGAVNSYVFINVTQPHTIEATFERIPIYTILSSAGSGGTIDPEGTIDIPEGDSQVFTITPNLGFQILDVLVDGQSQGALDSYEFSGINQNHTIEASYEQIPTFDIAAEAGAGGAIDPSGITTLNQGSSQDFSIVPDPGYRVFDVRVNQVSQGPIMSYRFEDVQADQAIEAQFELIPTFDILSSAGPGGTISPLGSTLVKEGDNQGFQITPDPGFKVLDVLVDGNSVGKVLNYTFTNVSGPHSIEVSFEKGDGLQRVVLVNADTEEDIGEIRDGREILEADVLGTLLSFRFETFPEQVGSLRAVLNGPVDHAQTENFAPYTLFGDNAGDYFGRLLPKGNYSLTVTPYSGGNLSGDAYPTVITAFSIVDEFSAQYSITATAGPGGTVSPSGTVTLPQGGSQEYQIQADTGYRIADVLVDGVSQGVPESYVFSGVSQNHTIEAIFELIPTFTISALGGQGGTILPEGNTTVEEGDNQVYTMVPDLGYRISDVIVDGLSQGAIGTYEFQNVTQDHSIQVEFEETPTYEIISSAGVGGGIDPSGSTLVNEGSDQMYSITASAGYVISDVVVNGESQGPLTSYTFTNVSRAHTIEAVFELVPPPSFDIIATAGPGGTISPSGTTNAVQDSDITYTITPDSGYRISHVLVDGVPQGSISSYEFTSITENHTIEAVFAELTAVVIRSNPNPQRYKKTTLTIQTTLNLSETPETFRDYRMNVTIQGPSGTMLVPAYFAGDGDAANTSAASGSVWKAEFLPEESGTYTATIDFEYGPSIAASTVDGVGLSLYPNGVFATVTVGDTVDPNGFYSQGKLQYVGDSHARFSDGTYFLEFGVGSPEVFLEYAEFDGTPSTRTYPTHIGDWNTGNPVWKSDLGKGIIGAVNYLRSQGMNINYFQMMNVEGDGMNAFPFTQPYEILTYDVSKLDQWQIVFDYMMSQGVAAEMVLLETENLNFFEAQSGNPVDSFSDERKIYYREMVARFGYLNAVIFTIGEEANWDSGGDQYTAEQIEEAAAFIEDLSPYKDLISAHNGPSYRDDIFGQILNLEGNSNLGVISYQGYFDDASLGHDRILRWINDAQSDGKPWVIRYTEPYTPIAFPDVEDWTDSSLWAALMAGAPGIHVYSGGGKDVNLEDYSELQPYFERMRHARELFESRNIPFHELVNRDDLATQGYLLSDESSWRIGFLPDGGNSTVTIPAGDYEIAWYNPRTGGELLALTEVTSNGTLSTGNPPRETAQSWVYLIGQQLIPTYEIEALAGTGGIIDPSGRVEVKEGRNQNFMITPNEGYRILDVRVDSQTVGPVESYEFNVVLKEHTIEATFELIPTYDIVASAGGGGTIEPAGTTSVPEGESQFYTITADTGYRIDEVIVDGEPQGPVNIYEFTDVNQAHTIEVFFVVVPTFTITSSAGPGGSITPEGNTVVSEGADQEYTITPEPGYRILDVRVNGESVGAVESYRFENILGTQAIEAVFEQIPTYDIISSAGEGGSIDPEGTTSVEEGAVQTYNVIPDAGYRVADVIVDDASVGAVESYAFEDVRQNHTVEALFEFIPTYAIVSSAGTGGTIDPIGTLTLEEGESQLYTITPDSGYAISDVRVDGRSQGAITQYTFENVTESHTIEATFVVSLGVQRFVLVNATDNVDLFEVSNQQEILQTDVDGMLLSFRFETNPEQVGSLQAVLNGPINHSQVENFAPYTLFGDATTNYFGREFPLGSYTLSVTPYTGGNLSGTPYPTRVLEFSIVEQPTIFYTITASAGNGGSIDPAGLSTLPQGSDQAYSITPDADYRISDVLVDGVSQGAISNYAFNKLFENHSIEAVFERIPTYDIVSSSGPGGTIDPEGTLTLQEGDSQDYVITAEAGYRVLDVLVDGVSVGALASYEFLNIMASHTIEAVFEPIPTYDIVSSAGAGGSIDPSGTTTLFEGEDQSYAIMASVGYRILDVLVDEESQGAITAYTFTDVSSAHTIEAIFEEIPTYSITAGAGEGGFIDPTGVIVVGEGATQAFTLTADANFRVLDLIVDNVSQGAIASYEFTGVQQNHTIEAVFEELPTYEIVSSAGVGGSIDPEGITAVQEGATQSFVITPDPGYRVNNLIVDGSGRGPFETFDFLNVDEDHTIEALFEEIPVYDIFSSAGDGGSISPAGTTQVLEFEDQWYTIFPDPGFQIQDVLVNGVSQGAQSEYAFVNVTQDQTISAFFAPTTGLKSAVLLNAETDTDLLTIENNMVIPYALVVNLGVNIRLETYPDEVGSVYSSLSGPVSLVRQENVAPYAAFGDLSGDYFEQVLVPGNYKLVVEVYESSGLSGELLDYKVINFAIDEETSAITGFIDPEYFGVTAEETTFWVYPNPIREDGRFYLNASDRINTIWNRLLIYDLNGRFVRGFGIDETSFDGNGWLVDPKGGLPTGTYLLLVERNGRETVTLRLAVDD